MLKLSDFLETLNQVGGMLYINMWMRILVILLYTDLFFTWYIPIEQYSVRPDLLPFIDGAFLIVYSIISILIISLLTVIIWSITFFIVSNFETLFAKKTNCAQHTYKYSESRLKEYALIKNNNIAYLLASENKKINDNLIFNKYIQISTHILLCVDIWCGYFINQGLMNGLVHFKINIEDFKIIVTLFSFLIIVILFHLLYCQIHKPNYESSYYLKK